MTPQTIDWHIIGQRIKRYGYTNREERQKFMANVFPELILDQSVLDVGCFNGALRQFVRGDYVGVDIYGKPDVKVNLEEGALPFPDKSFTTVVCADVLEHLEHFHQMFDECIRVSSQWVVISLPNCYADLWRPLVTRKYIDDKKYYGLPLERPLDRHRWYFSSSEARRFIHQRSAKNAVRVASLWYLSTATWRTKAILLPFLSSSEHRQNLLTTSIWAVISTR